MIPEEARPRIAKRLYEEVGVREDVGAFIFRFAALDSDRDVEYAMDILGGEFPDELKKAINIVLEEIVK